MEILSYPYRPKPWQMALASVFFGAMAFFMGREAMLNDRGLVIDHVIYLGTSGATIFYWCIAGIGAAFVAGGVPMIFVGLLSTRRITMTVTELSVPGYGFSRKVYVAKFSEILHVNTQVVQKQRFLNVVHTNGKLTINESGLPSRAAFEELSAAIISRVPESARS